MTRRVVPAIAIALMFSPAAAVASAADTLPFAQRWELTLERADASVHRIELDRAVYETAIHPALRDVAVVDANGEMQPSAILLEAAASALDEQRVALPWFPTPSLATAANTRRWRVITEIGDDQRLQRVETELLDPAASPPVLSDVLVDASQLDGAIRALELEWTRQAAPVDARYVLEYSNDLETWRSANAGARVIDLTNAGNQIQQNRIAIDRGREARYFRLRPTPGQRPPSVTGVQAVLAPPSQQAQIQWIELQGERLDQDGPVLVYRSPGAYPVHAVQVRPAANSSQRWQLESRADSSLRWRRQGPAAVAYRLTEGSEETLSPPLQLSAPSRDREWRLRSPDAIGEAPVLLLGYQPESLAFLGQGVAPFSLVAGSATMTRPESPIQNVLDAQRSRHGRQWMPAAARLGPAQVLAGDAALVPPREPRRYGHFLLWGVLILGSGLVTWLALGLLRRT